MSYPNPPPPPHQFVSPPFSNGGDGTGFVPPQYMMDNQNQQSFVPYNQMNPRSNNNPQVNVNKGTSHIFFKTRICAKFLEGTCKNGDGCSFAHGPHDLREPPPNWQDLIREKERAAGGGSWGGGSGEDDHGMIHRMKICKKYYNGEECTYGERCNFLHQRPFPPPVKKFKPDYPFEQRESAAISIGVTVDKGGSNGEYDQSFFRKTKICSKWEIGQCPFGGRCHFAHGQSDLRMSGGAVDEADVVINTGAIPRKSASVSGFNTNANLVVGAPPPLSAATEEQRKADRWKLNKKVNRIYGDWLDDDEEM